MGTYTIAFDEVLFATVPDGADLETALREEERKAQIEIDRDALTVESGLTLTDDPDEAAEVVWSGTSLGCLMDEKGTTFQYAVREGAR
jgi:hypothetical protein